jgi:hypothetical protein
LTVHLKQALMEQSLAILDVPLRKTVPGFVVTAVPTVIYLVLSAKPWFGPFARAVEEGLQIRNRLEESMRSASRSSRTWISHDICVTFVVNFVR